MGSDLRDATPGGLVVESGSVTKGDWRKALLKRQGQSERSTALERRNVNDFIRHVPVAILQKGTRLMHVTGDRQWLIDRESMIGNHELDDYSFFTLENRGMAQQHGNMFAGALKVQLAQDLHCFFAQSYSFDFWYSRQVTANRPRFEISKGPNNGVGGTLVGLVQHSWPAKYRPAAWASCSECEIAIHNSIVPLVLQVISIATRDLNQQDSRFAPLKESNIYGPTEGKHKGIDAPLWMSPYFHNRSRVKQAADRFRRHNQLLEEDENNSLFT
jgi:hypothetical protein